MHRQWHDVRLFDVTRAQNPRDPELDYMNNKGWTRAAVQEGAPGNGLEFLAMHRAMVTALRTTFAGTPYFAGWTTPPQKSTKDDPVPKGGARDPFKGAFSTNMQKAVKRLETQLSSFTSDDDIGLYIQTSLRWTVSKPDNASTDKTTSIHGYLHNRFDDEKSPIRMDLFSRNIENRFFWKLHAWIDNTWANYRKAAGKNDKTDAAYLAAMNKGCADMTMGSWDPNANACSGIAATDATTDTGMSGMGGM
jgi:hypothetical protein